MREFGSPHSRAEVLSVPAKILYTAFAALTLVGLGSSVLLYDDIVKFGARATPQELYQNLVSYYHKPPLADAPSPARPNMSFRKLLEVTHFHLFSVPIYLLVAGHLFLLTDFSQSTKLYWIVLGCVGTALHLLAPWLTYWGGTYLGWIYPISGFMLFAALAVMTCVPVWAMWRPRAGAGAPPAPRI